MLTHFNFQGYIYFQLQGLAVIAKAQKKAALLANKDVTPQNDIGALRDSFVREAIIEALTVHTIPLLCPMTLSCAFSTARQYAAGNYLMSFLACGSIVSCTFQVLNFTHMCFYMRLSQKLQGFEIRRCQADIRVCEPELIHRVTPRFKGLLHEAHLIGNKSHKFLFIFMPALLLMGLQFVGGIFSPQFKVKGSDCVPTWVFFAFFAPLVSLLVIVHAFAKLNVAFERDVDQDVSRARGESARPRATTVIRLSGVHVPPRNTRFARYRL